MNGTIKSFFVVIAAALFSSFLGTCFGYVLARFDPGIVGLCTHSSSASAEAAGMAVGAVCGLLLGTAVMLVLQAAQLVADAIARRGESNSAQ